MSGEMILFFKLPKLMSEVLLIVSYLDTEDLAEDF